MRMCWSNYASVRVVVLMSVLARFSVNGFNFFQRQSSHYQAYQEELIQDSRPVKSQGSWTDYSPWSLCSQTCGPGIQLRNRTCLHRITHDGLPDDYCTGEPKQIKVCKLQDCPSGIYSDFRQQECDGISTSEKIWKPLYYPDDPALNPCWLSCYSNEATSWKIVNHEVPDGTHCVIKAGPGVCINNECKTYGCDGLVGSRKVKDVCGVCDGDGSSCNVVTSTKIVNHLQVGYNEALEIPSGATNIRILELYGGKNYLALCQQDGTYVFNGNYRIENSRIFLFSGNICSYQRRESLEHGAAVSHREMFTCKGPLNESMTVMVLTRDRSPSFLAFEYTLPLEQDATAVPGTTSSTTVATTVSSTTSSTVSPVSATLPAVSSSTASSALSSVESSKQATSSIVSPSTSTTPSPTSSVMLSSTRAVPSTVSPITSTTMSSTSSTTSSTAASTTTPSQGALSEGQGEFVTDHGSMKHDHVPSWTVLETTPFRRLEYETESSGYIKLLVNVSDDEVSSVDIAVSVAGVRTGTEEIFMDSGDTARQRPPVPVDHHASHSLHLDSEEGVTTFYGGIRSSSGLLSDTNKNLYEKDGSVTSMNIIAGSGSLQTSDLQIREDISSKNIPYVGILYTTQEPVSSKQDSTLQDGTAFSSSPMDPKSDSFPDSSNPKSNFEATTKILPFLKNRLLITPTRKKSSFTSYQTEMLDYLSYYSFDDSFELAYPSEDYFTWNQEEFLNDRQTSEPAYDKFDVDVEIPSPHTIKGDETPSTLGTLLQGTVPTPVLSGTSTIINEIHSSLKMTQLPQKEKSHQTSTLSSNLKKTSLKPSVGEVKGHRDRVTHGEVTEEVHPPDLLRVLPELKFEEAPQREVVHVTLGIHFAELVDPRLSNITIDNQISSKAGNSSQGRFNTHLVESNQIPDFQPPVSNHYSGTTLPVKGTTESQSTNKRKASSTSLSPEEEVEISAARSKLTTPGLSTSAQTERVETFLSTTDQSTTYINTQETSIESITEMTASYKATTTEAVATTEISTAHFTSQAITTTTPVTITTTPITTIGTTAATRVPTTPTTTQSNDIAPILDYVWRVTAYSPCSATCRRGLQTEYAFCVNRRGETVPDNMCDQETKPEVIPRSCEGQPCEPRWVVGAWSSCSATCGGGLKFRTVSCWRMMSKGVDSWEPHANCNATEPATSSRICGTVECVLRWQVGEWSRCSAECGEGRQTRVVMCSVSDPSKGYCDPDSRPSDTRRCEGTRCQSTWGTSPWPECRGGCQLQTRRVNCYSPSGSLQPRESLCYSQPKPLSVRICGSSICAAQWIAQSWNQDNCRDCQRAYRTRTVSCQSVSGGRTVELSDDYCSHLSVPSKRSACSCSHGSSNSQRQQSPYGRQRSTPRWYTTRWSECSATCGGGEKHRKVKCYEGRIPSSRCDRSFMPLATQPCNTEECIVCTDNPQVKCNLIRQASLCKYKYYSDNCCRTCNQEK